GLKADGNLCAKSNSKMSLRKWKIETIKVRLKLSGRANWVFPWYLYTRPVGSNRNAASSVGNQMWYPKTTLAPPQHKQRGLYRREIEAANKIYLGTGRILGR